MPRIVDAVAMRCRHLSNRSLVGPVVSLPVPNQCNTSSTRRCAVDNGAKTNANNLSHNSDMASSAGATWQYSVTIVPSIFPNPNDTGGCRLVSVVLAPVGRGDEGIPLSTPSDDSERKVPFPTQIGWTAGRSNLSKKDIADRSKPDRSVCSGSTNSWSKLEGQKGSDGGDDDDDDVVAVAVAPSFSLVCGGGNMLLMLCRRTAIDPAII